MSILNTQDINDDLSVIEDGYGMAIKMYGTVGGFIWIALLAALREVGLKRIESTHTFGIAPDSPEYNFDELRSCANTHLESYCHGLHIVIDYFKIIDESLVLIGRYYNLTNSTERDEFELYFNRNQIDDKRTAISFRSHDVCGTWG